MEYVIFAAFAIAGVFMHIAMKFRDDLTKNPEKSFNEVLQEFQWKRQIFLGGLGIVTALILIAVRDEIENIYPITKVSAIAMGYAADSVWKNVIPERNGS